MLKLHSFKDQFTGNYLEITTVSDVIDQYGNVLTPTTVTSRLEDFFFYSTLDKGLQSTSEGAASVITIYSIGLVISGIVLSKSLKHLWGTLDAI